MKKILIMLALLVSADVMAKPAIVFFGQSNAWFTAEYGGFYEAGYTVINCSKGGAPIDLLMPSYDIKTLYGACLDKINKAVSNGDIVQSIVFWQGEAEAMGKINPVSKKPFYLEWMAKATAAIFQLRADIGNGNIPVVFVMINNRPHATIKNWLQIRNWHERIVMPNMLKLDSSKYPFESDDVHLRHESGLDQNYYLVGADIIELLNGK